MGTNLADCGTTAPRAAAHRGPTDRAAGVRTESGLPVDAEPRGLAVAAPQAAPSGAAATFAAGTGRPRRALIWCGLSPTPRGDQQGRAPGAGLDPVDHAGIGQAVIVPAAVAGR